MGHISYQTLVFRVFLGTGWCGFEQPPCPSSPREQRTECLWTPAVVSGPGNRVCPLSLRELRRPVPALPLFSVPGSLKAQGLAAFPENPAHRLPVLSLSSAPVLSRDRIQVGDGRQQTSSEASERACKLGSPGVVARTRTPLPQAACTFIQLGGPVSGRQNKGALPSLMSYF